MKDVCPCGCGWKVSVPLIGVLSGARWVAPEGWFEPSVGEPNPSDIEGWVEPKDECGLHHSGRPCCGKQETCPFRADLKRSMRAHGVPDPCPACGQPHKLHKFSEWGMACPKQGGA